MQDLTSSYKIALVTSSMSCGNTISDDPKIAMTAPGSQPVNPPPDAKDILPQPISTDGQIPLSNAPKKPRPQQANPGGGAFTHQAFGGTWKGTPANGTA